MVQVLGKRAQSPDRVAYRYNLPCPREVPFLLVDGALICPWRRRPHGVLTASQAEQLADVRALLAAARRPLPALAWVSVEGGIVAQPDPGGSWVARRLHDGQVFAVAAG